ncbi:hypothetical protein FRC18_000465 [Serendipita sp. 400]|nr:hypothetical protein FRC18_000465 [Serendipita sp. 400]
MQDGRTAKVKNRAAAAIQVTAEQLLRDVRPPLSSAKPDRTQHNNLTHRPKKGKRLSFGLQGNAWKTLKNSTNTADGREKSLRNVSAGRRET